MVATCGRRRICLVGFEIVEMEWKEKPGISNQSVLEKSGETGGS
jgi:hypothetical protein